MRLRKKDASWSVNAFRIRASSKVKICSWSKEDTLSNITRRLRMLFTRPRQALKLAYARLPLDIGSHDYTSFVVLTASRCGSSMLQSRLNAHPNIVCFGEKFKFLSSNSLSFVAQRIWKRYPKSIMAVGVKVFYYHPHDGYPAVLIEDLLSRRCKVIHLVRDPFDSAYSKLVAEQTNEYSSDQKSIWQDRRLVTISIDELKDEMNKRQDYIQKFERVLTAEDSILIKYEDVCADENALAGVFKFLACAPAIATKSHIVRQDTAVRSSDFVQNYAEIMALKKQYSKNPKLIEVSARQK